MLALTLPTTRRQLGFSRRSPVSCGDPLNYAMHAPSVKGQFVETLLEFSTRASQPRRDNRPLCTPERQWATTCNPGLDI